jgi:hypothetical protein
VGRDLEQRPPARLLALAHQLLSHQHHLVVGRT